jgi:hypothetical protein
VTELEQRAIVALRSVKMPEKNWHGRRAEVLSGRLILDAQKALRMDEKADLWFLVWRYRRQIDDDKLIRAANEMVNGALSLEF